jgi:shikimate kinase
MQVVLLLYGLPACGKRTIAKKIADDHKMVLLDNHFFNNIVYPYVGVDSETRVDISRYVYNIRQNFLDVVEKYSNKQNGYVFTNVLLDTPEDKQAVISLKKFAYSLGYEFIPVYLYCDEESVKERINLPGRAENHKLTDYSLYEEFINTTKFLSLEDSLSINTTENNIDESCEKIVKFIQNKLGE